MCMSVCDVYDVSLYIYLLHNVCVDTQVTVLLSEVRQSMFSPSIFVLVLVIKLRSSGLCAQHLYLLSHLPSPVLNVEVTH